MAAKKTTAKRRNATVQRTGANLWRGAFIAALSKYGNITKAAEAAGVNRATVYRAREDDKQFVELWDNALLEAADNIEFEALRRAKRGTLKPIYYQGKRVGYEREYSDTLMGMMLKGHKPDKYGDKLTVKVNPEDAHLLKSQDASASEAWEALMLCAAEAEKNDLNVLDVIRAVIDEMKVEQN